MPAPDPQHDCVLKSLRSRFPWKQDLELPDGTTYPYERVKAALQVLVDNGPEYYKCLHLYMFTTLSRSTIASSLDLDCSTVKRRLNVAVDRMLQFLNHEDMVPADLLTLYDYDTGTLSTAKFPITYPYADRNNF